LPPQSFASLLRLGIGRLNVLVFFVCLGPAVEGLIVEAVRVVSGGNPVRSPRP